MASLKKRWFMWIQNSTGWSYENNKSRAKHHWQTFGMRDNTCWGLFSAIYGRHDSQSWSRLCSRSVEKRKSDHHIQKEIKQNGFQSSTVTKLLRTRESTTEQSYLVQRHMPRTDTLTVTSTPSLSMETVCCTWERLVNFWKTSRVWLGLTVMYPR